MYGGNNGIARFSTQTVHSLENSPRDSSQRKADRLSNAAKDVTERSGCIGTRGAIICFPLTNMKLHSVVLKTRILALIAAGSVRGDVDYAREVKPLLKERCYSCHGALKQKAGLRLDTVALESPWAFHFGTHSSAPKICAESDIHEKHKLYVKL